MNITKSDPTSANKSTSTFPEALRLLLILTAAVFLAEMRNYLHISYFSSLPEHIDILVHILITTGMVFPFIYFFAYRPLLEQISERERSQAELKKARNEMERQVVDRTAKLLTTNKALQAEIEERRRVEDLLMLQTEAEHRQRQLAESLVQANLALANSLNPNDVFDSILEQVQLVIPSKAAAILLLEDNKVFLARYRGIRERTPGILKLEGGFPLDRLPQTERSINEIQPVLLSADNLNPFWNQLSGLEWIGSAILTPLAVKDEVLGILILASEEEGLFNAHHLALLQAFAAHAVLAIQNARLFEELRQNREHLQELTRRLVDVQENERRTISRELHDEAGQALTSIKLGLNLMEREVNNPLAVHEHLTEITRLTDQVMENIHNLAIDLRPASLEYLGLVSALQQYLASIQKNNRLEVQFESLGMAERLPIELEITLYRIVQEAVTNILRHARASRIDVLLEHRDKRLVAVIEDNGTGFNPAIYKKTGHLGLFGMRERAEMFGGRLVIESKPSSGTTIFVEIPYGD